MEEVPLSYIHEAAKRGHADQIEETLASDPKALNSKDSLGNTPLHWAASGGHYEACEVLIKAGADVNALNVMLDTPLHKAAWRAGPEVCQLLITHGAGESREKENKDGKTPLALARTLEVRKVVAPPVEVGMYFCTVIDGTGEDEDFDQEDEDSD